jgi:hypothetical protein
MSRNKGAVDVVNCSSFSYVKDSRRDNGVAHSFKGVGNVSRIC